MHLLKVNHTAGIFGTSICPLRGIAWLPLFLVFNIFHFLPVKKEISTHLVSSINAFNPVEIFNIYIQYISDPDSHYYAGSMDVDPTLHLIYLYFSMEIGGIVRTKAKHLAHNFIFKRHLRKEPDPDSEFLRSRSALKWCGSATLITLHHPIVHLWIRSGRKYAEKKFSWQIGQMNV